MKVLLNLILAMLLMIPAGAFAHGDEPHNARADSADGIEQSDPSVEVEQPIPGDTASSLSDQSAEHGTATGGSSSLLQNLHPATVHFPIALFLMAAITELFALRASPSASLEVAVRVMIYGGAAGAIISAMFGWVHTGLWFGGEAAMKWHRWMGTGIAALGILTAFLASRRADNRMALRIALFSIALLILAQGHLGGELAHGPNHLGL
ncbi:MAG: DUF2231 domain-containing protein [Alteraurantiacibacter sp.]